MSFIPNAADLNSLRQYLFSLPSRLNFIFTEDVKLELRKRLFFAVSSNGLYLDLFFPELFKRENDPIDHLESDLQWLLLKYVALTSKLQHNEGRDHHAYHTDLPCARVFRRGEPIYKCLTCGFNDTCALCSNCFQAESHEGHNISISICVRENGGVCDCGDPEAWVKDFRCLYYETNEVFERLRHLVPTSNLKETLLSTVGILLDFIIDVMCQSDQQFLSPQEVFTSIELHTKNRDLDSKKYGFSNLSLVTDTLSEKYSLIVYNDQIRHFRDAVQRIHLASKKVPEFAEMVARRIQSHGRATVIRSKNVNVLFERQKLLNATGLSSCIRNARDEFREEMCLEIIQWLESISSCDLMKANELLRDLFCRAFCLKWNRGVLSDNAVLSRDENIAQLSGTFGLPRAFTREVKPGKWNIDSRLWDHINHLWEECGLVVKNIRKESNMDSRFQFLAYLDIRFWKAFRLALHTMYATTLITNLKWKGVICYQYCAVYPHISDMFLNLDGDPEMNVMCTLSCQLFISPSNSYTMLTKGDVTRIFRSIYGFLKTGHTHSSQLDSNHDICLASLKNRRWGQLFFDIGYIISRGQNYNVALNDEIIPMTCDLLSLFQGKPTMRREVLNHVEYENSDYTAFFHAIPVIYQLAEYIAQCFRNVPDHSRRRAVLEGAIFYVTRFILSLEFIIPKAKEHNEVDYGPVDSQNDGTQPLVSFLHPLHLFLSWLIEYTAFDDRDALITLFANVADNCSNFKSLTESVNTLFHYPIQSIALAAQVKTGYWVRNGFSVKNQYQLYKSTGLREQGFIRDIFLTQIYLICHDADMAINEILKIWLLNDDIGQCNDSYEATVLPYILDECLHFFLRIITEGLFMKRLTDHEIIQTKIEEEIIHQLCLGLMTYSKLCSQLPDHIVSERDFEIVLEKVADFNKPRSGKEAGTFLLKEEFYDKINPYYHNYSLNKKDEAVKIVKERIRKKTNQPLNEVVINPLSTRCARRGLFRYLGNFVTASKFVEFLLRCIHFVVLKKPEKFDGLFDTLLHVVHSSAMEINTDTKESFCLKSLDMALSGLASLVSLLYFALRKNEFLEHHAKIRAIFECFSEQVADFHNRMPHVVHGYDKRLLCDPSVIATENDFERKKRLAQQRQSKLMARFKKQQSLFLERNNLAAEYSDAEMEDTNSEGWNFPGAHCILCQDTAEDAGPFGLVVHISRSSEFRDVPFDDKYWFLKAFSDSCDLNKPSSDWAPEIQSEPFKKFMANNEEQCVIGPGFPSSGHVRNELVSLTCGHGMHFNCYVQFLASNRSRSNQITRNTPDSIDHREFLCPLCKALNNMFLPVLWLANNRSMRKFIKKDELKGDAFQTLTNADSHSGLWRKEFYNAALKDLKSFSILTCAATDVIIQNSDNSSSNEHQLFRILLSNMFQNLSLLTFPQILKADSSEILVNTIKSTEISLRGVRCTFGLVFQGISNNSLINLRALNEFRVTCLLMKVSYHVKSSLNKQDTQEKLLANLLCLSEERLSESIVDLDYFKLLVDVLPLPTAGFTFFEILNTCYIGHIVQCLFKISANIVEKRYFKNENFNILDVPFSSFITPEDSASAHYLFRELVKTGAFGFYSEDIMVSPQLGYVIFSMLLKSVTPFLRRASIYAFINCPSDCDLDHQAQHRNEADLLCSFFNLPSLNEILKRMAHENSLAFSKERRVFDNFTKFLEQNAATFADSSVLYRQLEYPGIVLLVRLPERLDDFFTRFYYLEKHDFPHLSVENPAICMFCADVKDLQRTALGSPHGQCNTHYKKECRNSVGIFLLPKERSLLLLSNNGGSFHPIPYLDLHFEVAGDNKKTKAVFLLSKRYEDFTKGLWLQHNISNYIVRRLDGVIDAGGWETL